MTGRQARAFSSSNWFHCVVRDVNIPPGPAVGVALALGGHVIWSDWRATFAVETLAARLGVSGEYVRNTIEYLVALGYLADSGRVHKRRTVYVPCLPDRSPGEAVVMASPDSERAECARVDDPAA